MKHNLAIFPDHRVAIKQVEDFNKRFARPVLVKAEKPVEPQMGGIVYEGRHGKRLTTNALVKGVIDKKRDKGLTADEVRESLYPRRQR